MKITHNNTEYELDVTKALELEVLKATLPDRLQAGDVFVCPIPNTINPFLLVECLYGLFPDEESSRRWQLLGIGCSPNSGSFFINKLHTMKEIREYLSEKNMVKKGNIHRKVGELVNSF